MSQETPAGSLSFRDHCSSEALDHLSAIKLHPESAFKHSFFESLSDKKEGALFSRWLFWSIHAGVINAEIDPEKNLEKIILLRQEYEAKKAKYLKMLSVAEASDVDNPLSTQFRSCLELDTKSQINIDLVRMSIKPEKTKQYSSNIFNILYVWGMEYSAISYRQGCVTRHERGCGVPAARLYRGLREEL